MKDDENSSIGNKERDELLEYSGNTKTLNRKGNTEVMFQRFINGEELILPSISPWDIGRKNGNYVSKRSKL